MSEIREFFPKSPRPYVVLAESFKASVKFTVYGGTEYDADLDPLFDGYIKWDGCSNWEFVQYIHFCGLEEVNDFHVLLSKLYEWAASLMPYNLINDEE